MTVLAAPTPATDSKPWVLRYLWPILGVVLATRLVVDARFPLVPDEAVYWSWSRHLALGYFDHPPMIAWINWVSSHLIGSTELGVRFPMTLAAIATLLVIVATAKRVVRIAVGVKWVAIIWLVSPLLVGLATISTPDTPAIFFSTCALACSAVIADTDDRADSHRSPSAGWWMLFGVFCGLAFLSKYTTVLLPGAVVISLISSHKGRRHLQQPWIYLAALIAAIIFSPVVWWNYRHQWASFLFQIHHGVTDEPTGAPISGLAVGVRTIQNLLLYLGGQALLWTPVLFILGLVILFKKAKQFTRLSEVDRLLLLCTALPLGVFGLASAHKLGELNWPSFAYVPLSLLIGRWIAEEHSARRAHIVFEGCKLALIFTVIIHLLFIPGLPKLLAMAHVSLPHNERDLLASDRREYGRELATAADGALVVCNRHQDAAMASFYMPGQPEVWCDGVGSRPTAYDYFDVQPDFSTINRVLFAGGHVAMFVAKHHYSQSRMITVGPAGAAHPRTAVMVSR